MAVSPNQTVREGEELDEVGLKQFLLEHNLIADTNNVLTVQQFTNGFSNLTYLLKIEGKEYVLRRPPFGAIKRGHDMGREFKVQKALKSAFSKVPAMYAYTEDTKYTGSSFYVMEKINGIILSFQEAKKRQIKPIEYGTISNSWLDTMVALHQVDYEAVGLGDLGRPEGYVSRQVTNWGKQYVKAATDQIPAAAKVMRWMEEHQPKTYHHSLIHNDYKYDNVAFKDASFKEISAVLDWEMATLGDPLMDLGTSLGYWTMHSDNDFVKQGISSPTVFEGNPSRSDIVQGYAEKSKSPVDHIVFYYVYGLFKIAVIVQQIYYRYKHGYTADPRFAKLNKAAELCCNIALKSIQTNKID